MNSISLVEEILGEEASTADLGRISSCVWAGPSSPDKLIVFIANPLAMIMEYDIHSKSFQTLYSYGKSGKTLSRNPLLFPSASRPGVFYFMLEGSGSIMEYDMTKDLGKRERIIQNPIDLQTGKDAKGTFGSLLLDGTSVLIHFAISKDERWLVAIIHSETYQVVKCALETMMIEKLWKATITRDGRLDGKWQIPRLIDFSPLSSDTLISATDSALNRTIGSAASPMTKPAVLCGHATKVGYRDGHRMSALFGQIAHFVISCDGSDVKYYIADTGNDRIRLFDERSAIVSTIAGTNFDQRSLARFKSSDPSFALETPIPYPISLSLFGNEGLAVVCMNIHGPKESVKLIDRVGRIDSQTFNYYSQMAHCISQNHIILNNHTQSTQSDLLHSIIPHFKGDESPFVLETIFENPSQVKVEFDVLFAYVAKDNPNSNDLQHSTSVEAFGAHLSVLFGRSTHFFNSFFNLSSNWSHSSLIIPIRDSDLPIVSLCLYYLYTDELNGITGGSAGNDAKSLLCGFMERFFSDHKDRIEQLMDPTMKYSTRSLIKEHFNALFHQGIQKCKMELKTMTSGSVRFATRDGNYFIGSKEIICSLSPYFRNMLAGNMAESHQVDIQLDEPSTELYSIFRWIYCKQLYGSSHSSSQIFEILILASKFGITSLEKELIEIVCSNLSFENVKTVIQFAQSYQISQLERIATHFQMKLENSLQVQIVCDLGPKLSAAAMLSISPGLHIIVTTDACVIKWNTNEIDYKAIHLHKLPIQPRRNDRCWMVQSILDPNLIYISISSTLMAYNIDATSQVDAVKVLIAQHLPSKTSQPSGTFEEDYFEDDVDDDGYGDDDQATDQVMGQDGDPINEFQQQCFDPSPFITDNTIQWNGVAAIALNSDGTMLAISGVDEISFIRLPQMQLIRRLKKSSWIPNWISFNPAGDAIIVSTDTMLSIIHSSQGILPHHSVLFSSTSLEHRGIQFDTYFSACLFFSAFDNQFILVSDDEECLLWVFDVNQNEFKCIAGSKEQSNHVIPGISSQSPFCTKVMSLAHNDLFFIQGTYLCRIPDLKSRIFQVLVR